VEATSCLSSASMEFSLDWSLTGTLAGVAILTGVVGYGTLTLLGSGEQPTTPAPPHPVLLPSPAYRFRKIHSLR